MTSKERLYTVFAGGRADRTPVLGGWLACPEHICVLTDRTMEGYWADPVGAAIEAYVKLGMDGLIDIYVPKNTDDYRIVDKDTYKSADNSMTFQEALDYIDGMLSPEKIEASFDFDGEYADFREALAKRQVLCGDMVYMPAQWGAGAKVTWYDELGYENFFEAVGMYPDRARRLFEIGAARGRCRSMVVGKAVKEGLYPPAVLMGEDICSQRGPMISPAFLEKYYAPLLAYGLEPLLEAGCKPVWHCDGDVRPLMDMIIDCGAKGLQGFQSECGMTIEYVSGLRTKENNPLLVFGPMSVTRDLVDPDEREITRKVRHAIDVCADNADLVLFTANTINPDVPLKNILAMYNVINCPL